MRISTNQIYESASLSIQRNQTALYKLQNQMATGRRILSPEDDPVAAAQALVVTQSKEVNAQHIDNQDNASSQLGLVDTQLSGLVDLLQNIRDRVVQAGNTATLSNADRQSIAAELEISLGEMVGIANSKNGTGDYLFSGYQGATLPFAINGISGSYAYAGDDGERLLQVSASRQMAVNVAGSDVFMSAKAGNGTFFTTASSTNQGTGIIDSGSVVDPQQWALAVNDATAGLPIEIRFEDNAGTIGYRVYDQVGGLTPVPPAAPSSFTAGQAIDLTTASGVNFGGRVVVQGQPKAGDTFTIESSSNQSLFQTMQNLVETLRSPIGTSYTATQFSNALAAELTNLDQGSNNVSRVQAAVGTRLRELDSLETVSTDLDIQYEDTLSTLQSLDYAKAISESAMQKMYLEAAQKSFALVSGLSLFDYL